MGFNEPLYSNGQLPATAEPVAVVYNFDDSCAVTPGSPDTLPSPPKKCKRCRKCCVCLTKLCCMGHIGVTFLAALFWIAIIGLTAAYLSTDEVNVEKKLISNFNHMTWPSGKNAHVSIDSMKVVEKMRVGETKHFRVNMANFDSKGRLSACVAVPHGYVAHGFIASDALPFWLLEDERVDESLIMLHKTPNVVTVPFFQGWKIEECPAKMSKNLMAQHVFGHRESQHFWFSMHVEHDPHYHHRESEHVTVEAAIYYDQCDNCLIEPLWNTTNAVWFALVIAVVGLVVAGLCSVSGCMTCIGAMAILHSGIKKHREADSEDATPNGYCAVNQDV